MRHALAFSLATSIRGLSTILFAIVTAGAARASTKWIPYICPTMHTGSGTACFLEAIPQTYTMCRHIKSIEVIEFGLMGAQEGVNGAKTERLHRQAQAFHQPARIRRRCARHATRPRWKACASSTARGWRASPGCDPHHPKPTKATSCGRRSLTAISTRRSWPYARSSKRLYQLHPPRNGPQKDSDEVPKARPL